jgi:hypothetical protein
LAQKSNAVGFPKPGELIEIVGAHALETSDRALFNILYEHAHASGRISEPAAEWEIPLGHLRQLLSQHESNDRVRQSLCRLMSAVVQVPFTNDDGSTRLLLTHLFDFFDIAADEAPGSVVRYGIPRKLAPILVQSSRWGRIRLEVVCAMNSKYGLALYELIRLRANMSNCVETFQIGYFRSLMGVPPNAYKRGNDFQRFVCEPAMLAVNGISDMQVQIELRRRGGPRTPIVNVIIAWWQKEGDPLRVAIRELAAPKIGRSARLRSNTSII